MSSKMASEADLNAIVKEVLFLSFILLLKYYLSLDSWNNMSCWHVQRLLCEFHCDCVKSSITTRLLIAFFMFIASVISCKLQAFLRLCFNYVHHKRYLPDKIVVRYKMIFQPRVNQKIN